MSGAICQYHQSGFVLLCFLWCLVLCNGIALNNGFQSCQKDYFTRNVVNKNKTLYTQDYHNLKSICKGQEINKQCFLPAGELWMTLAHNLKTGKVMFVVGLFKFIKQGCWGYALQIETSSSTETIYFNFDDKKKFSNFIKTIDIQFGIEYTITVTALPTGKRTMMISKAPSLCELDVLVQIHHMLIRKEIFQNCHSPEYDQRLQASSAVCQLYPVNPLKRSDFVRSKLKEMSCQFVLKV